MPAVKSPLSAQETDHTSKRTLRVLLSGVFLVSFSLLALEIALTRLLSVALHYHYVFVVLSLALLGLGMGGIFVHIFRGKMQSNHEPFRLLALIAGLFALSVPVSAIAMTRIAYIGNLETRLLLFWLFLFLPFFVVGVLTTHIFRSFPADYSRIYGADLIGASGGALGVILILNALGGINTIFLIGITAAAGATLFALGTSRLKQAIFPILTFLAISGLMGMNLAVPGMIDVPLGTDRSKGSYAALFHSGQGAEIAETRWSAFGRTDLVTFRNTPEAMSIFIDGDAGTPMYRFGGDFTQPDDVVAKLKTDFSGYLGLAFLRDEEKDSALIIGPGGGRDVLVALMAGVRRVTAVEINADLVDIVRDYSSYNGGIYTDLSNVSVVVDEGRSFLKRQQERYDVIMLSLPVLSSSRSPEGFALAENFLFTRESIDDYLNHLTEDGRLVIVGHNPEVMLKLLSVSLKALEERGIDNKTAMKQIFIVGKAVYPAFVLKKTPFEQKEMAAVNELLHQPGNDPRLSWAPMIKPADHFYPVFVALGDGWADFSEVRRDFGKIGLDLSAPTDDSPFFYKFETGIPKPVSLVLWPSVALVLATVPAYVIYQRRKNAPPPQKGRSRRKDHSVASKEDRNKAVRPELVEGRAGGFLRQTQDRLDSPRTARITQHAGSLGRFAVLFLLLGAGFMLAEISAFQRFTLFLGRPVLSLAVLLFSLLAGAGIGSLYSGRFAADRISRKIAIFAAGISGLLIVFASLQPLLVERALGLALPARIFITAGMVGILGFFMGFPFPLGLRLMKETRMEEHVPWMWGINGVASIFGSALAIVLAMGSGLTTALLAGAACYFAVFLIFRKAPLDNSA